MKLLALDSNTKAPLQNTRLQFQLKGKESGIISLTTDGSGTLTLDDKYNGHQIAVLIGGAPGQWIAATNGAKLFVTTKKETSAGKAKSTHPMGSHK
jgi:hypothetical protein